jgi:RNase P subunit RPR2
MRSKNRQISKRMQEHIMREIHSDICRLCYGGEPVD